MKLKPDQELPALALLKSLPLFNHCAEDAIQAMVKFLDARDILAGKVLLMDQEIARTLFVLAKGSVGVWKRVSGEKKQLATLRAPDFFGERSMFEEAPASALVKTDERCLIYALERAQFDQVAAQCPAILDPLRQNMAEVRLKRIGPTPQQQD